MLVLLEREASVDTGTFGRVRVFRPTGIRSLFECVSLELPWRENARRKSCIPAGEYRCERTYSPSKGEWLYEVMSVPGRSGIRIHVGNWAGDVEQGLKSDVEGCILLGRDRRVICRQEGVSASRLTLNRFHKVLDGRPFSLRVVDGEGEVPV